MEFANQLREGLLLGTLLTLFVIPVAYTLLMRDRTAIVSAPRSLAPIPQK